MAKGGRRLHSGRPRKPTAMKVVQGTFRADRHGDELATGEPKAPNDWPAAPKHLTERERVYWQQLKPLCATWVAKSDVFALNGVVSLFDRIVRNQEAQRASDEAGHPLAFSYKISADGDSDQEKHMEVEAKENPLITQEVKLWRELRAFMAITGLSPVDRARVTKSGEGEPQKPTALQDLMRRAKQQ